MAQVVSRLPLTAEAGVRSMARLCRLYDGQIGTGAGFSLGTSVFPWHYRCTSSLYSCFIRIQAR